MIKNEKQYKISKKYLENIHADIRKVESDTKLDPIWKEIALGPLHDNKEAVERELMTYEDLKKNKRYILKERMIGDLPMLLIEYKIMMGYTQKEFAAKLGLKEQQLQRYEAEDFKSVTFKNLLKFIQSIGLQVEIKDTPLPSNAQSI